MHEMSNLKLGRRGIINSLTLLCRIFNRLSSQSRAICKYDRYSIPIMKLLRTSNGGGNISVSTRPVNVNRRNFRHLLSTARISPKEARPISQYKVMSVIFSAGSNSAKSSRSRIYTSIRSISTWRQFLRICEEVSSVLMNLKCDQCYLFHVTCFFKQNVQFLQFLQASNFVMQAIR